MGIVEATEPYLTVTDGLNLLTATGTPITDTRNGIVKPRIQIDAALNVALNAPLTLNYSAEIGYGSNGVSPASGTASTQFTYKVVYTDMTNIAPSSIRACIDDTCNAMSKDTGAADPALRDSSFTNGEQYVYTSTLVAGAHSYYFDATRGATTVTLPASGALSAPTVSDLAISTTTLPNGDVGIAYISNPQASGGTPPYSWSASGLPGGLSIYPASGVISGTPTQSGLFGFMVSVSDAASAVFSKVFSIVIVDNVVPTVPTGLTASAASATQINLSWSASTDNVGVTGYKVYRDGVQVGNPVGTFFIDTGLTAATAYNYTVAACDAAGNCSAQSNIVSATTLVGTTPGTLVAWGYNAYGQATVPSGLNGVVAVAAGFGHTVALKNDGTLAAWGYNYLGQATIPSGLSGVVAVTAGNLYTVALKNDGKVVAWGDNAYGQTSVPDGLSGVVAIAAKSITTVALKNDGTVVAWGDNTNGVTSVPAGLSGVVAIASGNNHIVALKNDGTVVAWGGNNSGETTVPQGLNGVVAIAAGMYHTVALKSDGTVVTWGYNSNGQMSVPSGLSGVAAIAANLATTVPLKNDGTVVAWGDNTYGQTMIPASLSGVTSISAGAYHTVAVFVDNTVPSVPTGLTASASNASQINLSWTASSDNVGVGGYKVYRNGVQVGTSTLTSFSDTGLTAATTYNYTVAACDAAGNCSAQSTAVSAITSPADTTPPAITPSVPGGVYNSAQNVTLSANEPATIYYTLDGSTPTTASMMYSLVIAVNSSLTLKYFAVDTAGNASAVQAEVYVIDTVAPTVAASVVGGTYSAAQSVTLSANEPATICYTLDDTMPTTASAVYTAPISISTTKILKYFGKDTAGNVGAVLTQVFVIDTVAPTVTASVAGGTYTSVQSVTLIASEPATIYFTLDGTMPTTASAVYSAAIMVNSSLTLKYFAVDTAGNVGAVQTQVYVINLLDTIAPVSSVLINGGAPVTFTATVALTIAATDNSGTVAQMRFSNNGTNWSAWEAYATSKAWTLSTGFGNKTVYAQSKDAAGNISVGVSDSINYFPDVDLAPILLSTTATSVKTGRSLTVRDTVKNQGNVATTASNFKMSYYLSIDPAITSADIRIGSRTISSLAAGASNTASTTLTIPTNMARGVYYLGVVADSANVQPENNETNNTLAGKAIIIQ